MPRHAAVTSALIRRSPPLLLMIFLSLFIRLRPPDHAHHCRQLPACLLVLRPPPHCCSGSRAQGQHSQREKVLSRHHQSGAPRVGAVMGRPAAISRFKVTSSSHSSVSVSPRHFIQRRRGQTEEGRRLRGMQVGGLVPLTTPLQRMLKRTSSRCGEPQVIQSTP